jgi:D-alanyl-lipoteichoic acid acyltransferase DltB (MBOAT superfamily)
LLFAALLDYYVSLEIDRHDDPVKRKRWLILSVSLNLAILFYFKYSIFFCHNLEGMLNLLGSNQTVFPTLNIILPIGISFYTFETISYTVDVYRRHIKPERNFIHYLTFLLYFPHLIAGPILRAADILPQLAGRLPFSKLFIAKGFKRLVIGLFLKVVIADNIAPLVDQGFAMPSKDLSAIDVWTLAFMFGFQIYFDFAAYSHIAIGCAQMMGIRFPENFNFPYLANSPKAFWKRWHISLSSWIKDYLYLPLTGQKVMLSKPEAISEIRHSNSWKGYSALFLTWAIMGFWHGANFTFIIWGLYHALLVTMHRLSSPLVSPLPTALRNLGGWMVSLPLLMLGWIPFRVTTVEEVGKLWQKVLKPSQYSWLGLRENTYLIAFLLLVLVVMAYVFDSYIKPAFERWAVSVWVDMLAMTAAIVLLIIFLRPISQFIYFQF